MSIYTTTLCRQDLAIRTIVVLEIGPVDGMTKYLIKLPQLPDDLSTILIADAKDGLIDIAIMKAVAEHIIKADERLESDIGGLMKKYLIAFLAVLAVMAIPVMAQATDGPSIDPTTMEAILVLMGGGIVTAITGILKGLLKATGTGAVVLAGIVAVVVTAAYFVFFNPPFELLRFVLYAAAAFGEATGFFHIYKRATV